MGQTPSAAGVPTPGAGARADALVLAAGLYLAIRTGRRTRSRTARFEDLVRGLGHDLRLPTSAALRSRTARSLRLLHDEGVFDELGSAGGATGVGPEITLPDDVIDRLADWLRDNRGLAGHHRLRCLEPDAEDPRRDRTQLLGVLDAVLPQHGVLSRSFVAERFLEFQGRTPQCKNPPMTPERDSRFNRALSSLVKDNIVHVQDRESPPDPSAPVSSLTIVHRTGPQARARIIAGQRRRDERAWRAKRSLRLLLRENEHD